MKKVLIPFVCFCLFFSSNAHELFDQLVAFNPNWNGYEQRVESSEAVEFTNDQQYVQTHLTQVLEILKGNPTSTLTCDQLAQRKELIEVLTFYRNRGLFPLNYYRSERIPVFIDEHDTHCAVGFMLKETGYELVARRIAAKNNYAWVVEIDDPALPSWQASSGFTMEELKLIQGAYDFYIPNARVAPNKNEIPQQPAVVSLDFNGNETEEPTEKDVLKVWCYGEGKDGILHGKWVQNYRKGIPWIVGYYENGNRTGSWKEYYQGTKILCRTEHWRNDKLNGVRTRFDRSGNVIERITFKDGEAVEKINYDLQGGIEWVRKPIDSITLQTQAFSLSGYLLAQGNEQVSNPSGKLQWFQDIELTALNTFAITARDGAPEYTKPTAVNYSSQSIGFPGNLSQSQISSPRVRVPFGGFNQGPSLVNYKKVGEWKYYNEYTSESYTVAASSVSQYLQKDFPHFAMNLLADLRFIEVDILQQSFDSLQVQYVSGVVKDFRGFGINAHARIGFLLEERLEVEGLNQIPTSAPVGSLPVIRGMGPMDENGRRVGDWTMYDVYGRPSHLISYIQPFKAEEPLSGRL